MNNAFDATSLLTLAVATTGSIRGLVLNVGPSGPTVLASSSPPEELADTIKTIAAYARAGEFEKVDQLGAWYLHRKELRPNLTSVIAFEKPETLDTVQLIHDAIAAVTIAKLDRLRIAEANALLQNIETMAGIGVWDIDLETEAVTWSDVVYRLHGIQPGAVQPSLDLVFSHFPEEVRGVVRNNIARAIETRSGFSFVLPFRRADGELRTVRCVGQVATIEGGGRLFGILQDVTEIKEAELRLWWTANHDPLTQLPNRMLFQERLTNALEVARETARCAGLILVDVDEFKSINDVYGHDAGDDLLRFVAQRLAEHTRKGDTLARLGGDEFAVIVYDLMEPSEIERPLDRLIQAANIDFSYRNVTIPVKLSLGAAIYPHDATDDHELYRNADLALFQAKSEPATRGLAYDPSFGEEQEGRELALRHIRAAIGSNAIVPNYHPIVELGSGSVVAIEVVAGWKDEGRVAGNGALDTAIDDAALAPLVGMAVLEQLKSNLAEARDAGYALPPICLNVALRQLQNLSYMDALLAFVSGNSTSETAGKVILALDTNPSDLELRHGKDAFANLVAMGVELSFDNLAAGFAALVEPEPTEVRQIKVDKRILLNIDHPRRADALFRGLVAACRRLNVQLVATDLETQDEVDRLRALGYTHGQGDYLLDGRRLTSVVSLLEAIKPSDESMIRRVI